jgi:YHS domain-containing protein
VPVLLVWAATEAFYRFTENNYTYKTKVIKATSNEIETLVFGDSHPFFGINPEHFTSNTFNIANVSQSLYFDELLLEKYIENLPNLKNVVLNISYFTLSVKDDSSEDRWRKYFYQQDMEIEIPSISIFDPKQYSLTLNRRFNKSVELFRDYLKNGTIVSAYENGYGMQDETSIVPDKEIISELIAKKHEDNSLDFEKNINHLQRIINLCKKHNVEVYLIEMPVYKTYYGLLDPTKKKKIKTTLSQWELKNEGVYYYDFCEEESFVDSDFRDADHLTNEGAEKFSKLLNGILENNQPNN